MLICVITNLIVTGQHMKAGKTGIIYAMIQILYWAAACLAIGYAAAFLQEIGYSNSQLGIVLATGQVLGFFLSLLLSTGIDKLNGKSRGFLMVLMPLSIALSMLLIWLLRENKLALGIAYVLCISLNTVFDALLPKLFSDILHAGTDMQFAFPRAAGSVSYGITGFIIGRTVSSVEILPLLAAITAFILCLFVFLLSRLIYHEETTSGAGDRPRPVSLAHFIRREKSFILLIIGCSLVLAVHGTVARYTFIIMQDIGGNVKTYSDLTAFIAFIELPVMILYGIMKKKSYPLLLKLSLLFFVVKLALTILARNIPMFFFANAFQMISFALYTTVIVDYINSAIPYEDSAKAFSLMGSLTMVATVILTAVSGALFDRIAVRPVLLMLLIFSVLGAVLAFCGIKNRKKA